MRFSLITSVLALSLAVRATPFNRFQPNQSFINCKNKLEVAENSVSNLLQKLQLQTNKAQVTGSYKSQNIREAILIEPSVEKDLKDALDECKKVTHLSSEAAAIFEKSMNHVTLNTESIAAAAQVLKDKSSPPNTNSIKEDIKNDFSLSTGAIENIITLYKHFENVSSGVDKDKFKQVSNSISY